MNSTQHQKILTLLKSCINSEIDLLTFCEEFSFHAFHLEDGYFKNVCAELMEKATNYLLNNPSVVLSPNTLLEAADLFDLIRKTYDTLIH